MIKYCPTNNLKYHNRIAMALINVNTNSASPLTLTLNKMENNKLKYIDEKIKYFNIIIV